MSQTQIELLVLYQDINLMLQEAEEEIGLQRRCVGETCPISRRPAQRDA